jgi:hypothetical protein
VVAGGLAVVAAVTGGLVATVAAVAVAGWAVACPLPPHPSAVATARSDMAQRRIMPTFLLPCFMTRYLLSR